MEFSDTDLNAMALTLWGECRGECREGQIAVAWIIRNRWQNPGWWSRQRGDGITDDTITAVCRDPWQFSCWHPSDPQSKKIQSPQTLNNPDVLALRALAADVLAADQKSDPTDGADHYCTKSVARNTRWARGRKPVKVIGNHQFYKIGLG
jgi:hypothetical protein